MNIKCFTFDQRCKTSLSQSLALLIMVTPHLALFRPFMLPLALPWNGMWVWPKPSRFPTGRSHSSFFYQLLLQLKTEEFMPSAISRRGLLLMSPSFCSSIMAGVSSHSHLPTQMVFTSSWQMYIMRKLYIIQNVCTRIDLSFNFTSTDFCIPWYSLGTISYQSWEQKSGIKIKFSGAGTKVLAVACFICDYVEATYLFPLPKVHLHPLTSTLLNGKVSDGLWRIHRTLYNLLGQL